MPLLKGKIIHCQSKKKKSNHEAAYNCSKSLLSVLLQLISHDFYILLPLPEVEGLRQAWSSAGTKHSEPNSAAPDQKL